MDSNTDLQILVTKNTEYHVSGTMCVGVRDSRSGRWNTAHQAIGAELLGSFHMRPDGAMRAYLGSVDLGHRLYFSGDILTSPLMRVIVPKVTAGEDFWELEAA